MTKDFQTQLDTSPGFGVPSLFLHHHKTPNLLLQNKTKLHAEQERDEMCEYEREMSVCLCARDRNGGGGGERK